MPNRGDSIDKRKDRREEEYPRQHGPDENIRCRPNWEQSYQEDKEQGSPASIGDALEYWLEAVRVRVKESTHIHYRQMIDHHILPFFGEFRLDEWGKPLLSQFIARERAQGNQRSGGGVSASTVATMVYIVRSAVNMALEESGLPTREIKIIIPREREKGIRIFTRAEQKRLEELMYANTDYKKLGILICLYTGLRVGEICALKRGDIQLDIGKMEVSRTIQRVKNISQPDNPAKTRLLIDTPKSYHSRRDIPLPSFLCGLLEKYAAQLPPEAYILSGSAGSIIEPRVYQCQFKRYLQWCGIESANFHALRHTFASRCIESGFDAKSLSEILGHSNVNMTLNRYVHPSFDSKKDQMDKLCPAG